MTTWTSTAAYSLMTCKDGGSALNITPNKLLSKLQARSTESRSLGGVGTCLTALAPTESTKQTDVQSKTTEWMAPGGSGTRASCSRSSSRPFRSSSSAATSARTSWVTPLSLNWSNWEEMASWGCDWRFIHEVEKPKDGKWPNTNTYLLGFNISKGIYTFLSVYFFWRLFNFYSLPLYTLPVLSTSSIGEKRNPLLFCLNHTNSAQSISLTIYCNFLAICLIYGSHLIFGNGI